MRRGVGPPMAARPLHGEIEDGAAATTTTTTKNEREINRRLFHSFSRFFFYFGLLVFGSSERESDPLRRLVAGP